jgi:hypothetical protein
MLWELAIRLVYPDERCAEGDSSDSRCDKAERREGMLISDVIKAAIFPFMELTARSIYKSASRWKRAKDNHIR